MTPKLKIVFDTNVYLAAAINPGGPSDGWLRIAGSQWRSFDLYTSELILAEVANKLLYKFGASPKKVSEFIESIRGVSTLIRPERTLHVVEKDPDDNMLFECALTAQAQLIVSADREVLKIKQYQNIGVCHPRDLKYIFAQDLLA